MRILGSIVLCAVLAFANLKVYLKQNPIYQGEPAQLVIEATGDDIELPKLDKIGPYRVTGIANAESVMNLNGNLTVKKSETLTFYPDANLTIGPITAVIDGKKVTSQPLRLVVKQAPNNGNVQFSITLSKKEAYVGEPLVANLELKIKRTLKIVDYSFQMPKLSDFWVKQLKATNKYLEERGDYLVKRIKLLLIPQKPGVLLVGPAIFKYAVPNQSMDMFGFSVTAPVWKSVASNSVRLRVKALPQNVDIVGDFHIDLHVDKKRTKAGKPVNVTLTIAGVGNLENFSGVDLQIPNATVYADTPHKKEHFASGQLHSVFSQTFSIIAESDFTIPALDIPYFSLTHKRIEHLTTKPITIKVEGGKHIAATAAAPISGPSKSVKQPSVAASHPCAKKFDFVAFLYGFLSALGLIAGAIVLWRVANVRITPKKFLGDKKALLNRLMPYISKDPRAAAIAQALYEELYEGKKHGIKKKEVEALLKDLM